MLSRGVAFILSMSAAFAQVNTPSGSVTVTAALGQNVQPDQVAFLVSIQSPLTATLDDVMGALQGSGITLANFLNLSSAQQYSTNGKVTATLLVWSFQLPVSLANLKSETAVLQALSTTLGKGQSSLALSYTINGQQTSNQALAQACAMNDLVASARTKARQVAVAANQTLGSVLSLSTSVSTQIGPSAVAPYVIPSCTLTVVFGSGQPQVPSMIRVSATRMVNVPPDLAVVGGSVYTAAAASVDDALAALAGTGLTASNLTTVYSISPANLEWQFSLTVPIAKLKDTLAAFQKIASTTVTFAVQGVQTSAQLVAAQDCSYTSLLNDAQAQARQVTAAAGVALNGLIAVSDAGTVTQGIRTGDFSAIFDPSAGVPLPYVYNSASSCGLTATFGIGQ
jgi:uncharacterized protein YggE